MVDQNETRAAIVANARRLLTDAEILFKAERYPTALAIAILAVEEVGKMYLTEWNAEKDPRRYHAQKQSVLGSFYFGETTAEVITELVATAAKKFDLPEDPRAYAALHQWAESQP